MMSACTPGFVRQSVKSGICGGFSQKMMVVVGERQAAIWCQYAIGLPQYLTCVDCQAHPFANLHNSACERWQT